MNLHRSIFVPLVFSAPFLAGCGLPVDGRPPSGMVPLGPAPAPTAPPSPPPRRRTSPPPPP
ncbi:hypothetical protein DIS09_29200, partial [Burkholderia pseudomallei]